MTRRDSDKQKVYDAEAYAFTATPLADLVREEEVQAAYRVVLNSAAWAWGDVSIRSARVDMVNHGGKASGKEVITSAGRTHRYTVSHELAHVMVRRQRCFDPGHGASFRRMHLYTVGAIFGHHYSELLLNAYTAWNLAIDLSPNRLPSISAPVIDIDALSIATAPRGGWRKPA